jgi:hypothetical protein
MKSRTVIILVVLAIAAVAITAMLERERPDQADSLVGQRLMPDLEKQLNDITALKVVASGDDGTATITREESGWVVVEKSGYAADAGAIRQFLIRLAEARVLEEKTSNPELYGRLGVGDVGADGGGVQLSLEGLASPRSVIVGDLETRAGRGTYLRLAGGEQSYLVDAELDPPETAVDWLDRNLFDIPADEVLAITVRQDDGELLRIVRGDVGLEVLDVPEGRSLSSPTAPRSMGGVLKALTFEDVTRAEDFRDEPPAAVAEYRLEDGRVLTIDLWQRDTGRFAALRVAGGTAAAASADGDTAAAGEETESAETGDSADSGEQTAPAAEADDTTGEQASATAAALNERFAPWVFRIPAFKYDLMARKLEDLLAPPEIE